MTAGATVVNGHGRPKILMVAMNYPPASGSSGVHRTTSFAKHLARHGWDPVVLTVAPWAHPERSSVEHPDGKDGVRVLRPWTLDAARHLALRGKYLSWTAYPDRWASWLVSGTLSGLLESIGGRPAVIWSTCPNATAHRGGLTLHRLTGAPWVADFRDPMIQDASVVTGTRLRMFAAIERAAVRHARSLVFVSASARDSCMARYPQKRSSSFHVIENGYDEEAFVAAERLVASSSCGRRRLKLLHSGAIYLSGRNPIPLLDAIAALRARRASLPDELEVVFRGSTVDAQLRAAIATRGLEAIVSVERPLEYAQALGEMLDCDALLLLQGSIFNRQIPAKAYEYLRSGRPILALTDAAGESARLLKEFAGVQIADLETVPAISEALDALLGTVRPAAAPLRRAGVDAFSRDGQARRLNELLAGLRS